jgi:hypothetical protein
MLHDWDGRNSFVDGLRWGDFVDLNEAGEHHWGVPTVRGVPVDRYADHSRFGKLNFGDRQVVDFTGCEFTVEQLVSLQVESSVEFYDLQKKLVASYKEQQRLNRVLWLRS